MSQRGKTFLFQSIDGTNFAGGLAQNIGVMEHLALPTAVAAARSTCLLRSALIISSDNLNWDLEFYATKDGPSPDPNQDSLLGFFQFAANAAIQQDGGTGLWYYYINTLDIGYFDLSVGANINVAPAPSLHVRLVNRSAVAKTAYGVGGHLVLKLEVEPTLAF
jgi:hypothetical protein